MKTAKEVQKNLRRYANPERGRFNQRFFRTGPGEYGEGDRFLGIVVPDVRRVVRAIETLPYPELNLLLASEFHEDRLAALVYLVRLFERGRDEREKSKVYAFYVRNFKAINNWDLVDVSAPAIVGRHLLERSRAPLYRWARSKNLWQKRIAIVSTLSFIRQNEVDDTLAITKILLNDSHDLIHKACGWMLREAWKRSPKPVEKFLHRYGTEMPRTMLRYAIERVSPTQKKVFMSLGRKK